MMRGALPSAETAGRNLSEPWARACSDSVRHELELRRVESRNPMIALIDKDTENAWRSRKKDSPARHRRSSLSATGGALQMVDSSQRGYRWGRFHGWSAFILGVLLLMEGFQNSGLLRWILCLSAAVY